MLYSILPADLVVERNYITFLQRNAQGAKRSLVGDNFWFDDGQAVITVFLELGMSKGVSSEFKPTSLVLEIDCLPEKAMACPSSREHTLIEYLTHVIPPNDL